MKNEFYQIYNGFLHKILGGIKVIVLKGKMRMISLPAIMSLPYSNSNKSDLTNKEEKLVFLCYLYADLFRVNLGKRENGLYGSFGMD
jgi:hypothetical protein